MRHIAVLAACIVANWAGFAEAAGRIPVIQDIHTEEARPLKELPGGWAVQLRKSSDGSTDRFSCIVGKRSDEEATLNIAWDDDEFTLTIWERIGLTDSLEPDASDVRLEIELEDGQVISRDAAWEYGVVSIPLNAVDEIDEELKEKVVGISVGPASERSVQFDLEGFAAATIHLMACAVEATSKNFGE